MNSAVITRTDVVKMVNERLPWGTQRLLPKHWQRALFIARQNGMLSATALKAIAKHGYVRV